MQDEEVLQLSLIHIFAIKMPVFSFEKIRGAEISLGPEMKSTGECLGIAESFNEALYLSLIHIYIFQFVSHDGFCCQRNDRDTGYLADVRNGTAGTWINLDDIDFFTA